MAETEKTKPDWEKFNEWEKEYETSVYRSLEPIEKLRILEDLYRTHLKILPETDDSLRCDVEKHVCVHRKSFSPKTFIRGNLDSQRERSFSSARSAGERVF